LTDNSEDAVSSLEYLLRVARRLLVAIAICFVAGLASASAQTVIVQNAAPGSTAEFVLNGNVLGTGTAGADGLVTLAASQGALPDGAMQDVLVWVDRCDTLRRVIVVERIGTPPPAGAGCLRTAMTGLFLLQRETTIVVNVERDPPTMRLRQGPAPAEWLVRQTPGAPVAAPSIVPRGLIVFGGGGLMLTGDFASSACGDAPTCDGEEQTFSATGGVEFWPSQYIGIGASFLRPRRINAEGSGDGYEFTSDMDGGLLLFAGKVGVPLGRVRLFGMGGMNLHRATFTTAQAVNESSQTYQWRTEGWGPAFGGGVDVWLSSRVGVYGEVLRLALRGDDVGGSEAQTDMNAMSIVIGLRLRLFGE
jgi:hypothetical protein